MDREKVIKGLERFIRDFKPFCGNKADWQRVEDTLALLKAQEPRVMTLEEYKALAEKPKKERDPVWEEWSDMESTWAIPNQAYGGYGTSWRCWTSRPTDEQREKEPWNG